MKIVQGNDHFVTKLENDFIRIMDVLFIKLQCEWLFLSWYQPLTISDWLTNCLSKRSSSGVNRGFRVVNNSVYTYNQVRDGFSYFYPKRKILEDGITTRPLDIWMIVITNKITKENELLPYVSKRRDDGC